MALNQIKVAAVTLAETDRMRQFFIELEEKIDEFEDPLFNECDLGEWIVANYCRIRYDWNCLIFAYETVYQNACDQTVRHLEWKPEIKAALKAASRQED